MLLPSIGFPGSCSQAIEFYKEAVGAEVKQLIFARDALYDDDLGLPPDFVTYSEVLIGGTPVMMCDGTDTPMTCGHFWFTLSFDTPEEAVAAFNKLAEGGEITEPLAPQFFAALNGSVKDRFGVIWNVGTKE